jgi:hypothetical protein
MQNNGRLFEQKRVLDFLSDEEIACMEQAVGGGGL